MSLDDPTFVEQFVNHGAPLDLNIKFAGESKAIPFQCTVSVEDGKQYLIIKLKVEGALSAKLELLAERIPEQVQAILPEMIPLMMRTNRKEIKRYLTSDDLRL